MPAGRHALSPPNQRANTPPATTPRANCVNDTNHSCITPPLQLTSPYHPSKPSKQTNQASRSRQKAYSLASSTNRRTPSTQQQLRLRLRRRRRRLQKTTTPTTDCQRTFTNTPTPQHRNRQPNQTNQPTTGGGAGGLAMRKRTNCGEETIPLNPVSGMNVVKGRTPITTSDMKFP